MKKYVPVLVAAAVIVVLAILAFSSCGGKTPDTQAPQEQIPTISQEATQTMNVYYRNASGYLVPVARQIAKQDNMAQTALDLLHDTSANWSDAASLGVMPTLPEGATAKVSVSGGIAQVDLHGLVCTDEKSENMALSSMTATLLDMPQIDVVRYTVDGKASAMLPFGTSISQARTTATVNALDDALTVSAGQSVMQVRLAYIDPDTDLLVPVTRSMQDGGNLSAAVSALSAVEEETGLVSAIPSDCQVLGASVTDDTAIIDMSASFADLSAQQMQTAARALTYTAMQNDDVLDVVIRAGGRALDQQQVGSALPVALNVASERLSVLQTIGTGEGDAIENDAVDDGQRVLPTISPRPTTPLVSPSPAAQTPDASAMPSASPNRK